MAMTTPRHVLLVALVLLAACRDEVEPVPLYDGEWIDVGGIGRERSDTCVGTFDYVDAYAGALAAEFGIDGPIGSFIWYTPEDFDDSTEISEGKRLDVDVLSKLFASPSAGITLGEYEMLGRFAGFLVERYGLKAVLEVCAVAGRDASGAQLAAAMQAILGASPDELIAALSQEPDYCNDFDAYRSNVFACGVAAAAPSLGSFAGGHLEARLEFGCDQPDVVGPFEDGTFQGRMLRTLRLMPKGLTLRVSQCRSCGDRVRAESDVDWGFPLLVEFDAGRYSVEIAMPEDYVGTVRLEIDFF